MPAPKTQPAGGDLYAYYNDGSYGTPAWVEIKRLGDLDFADNMGASDAKIRGNKYAKAVAGKRSLTVSGAYNRTRNADAVWDDLRTAYVNHTPIELALCDRPIAESGAKGTRAHFLVTKMDGSEPLEGPWTAALEFKHTEFEDGGDIVDPSEFTTP